MSRGQPVHIKAGKVDVRRQKKWDRQSFAAKSRIEQSIKLWDSAHEKAIKTVRERIV